MGDLSLLPLGEIREKYNLEVFVETGTETGGGVLQAIKAEFDEIYSCEIEEGKYNVSYERFSKNSKVNLYWTSSKIFLEMLLPKIKNKKTLFWLDAHTSIDDGKCIDLRFPIIDELKAIVNHKSFVNDVIIIDDLNLVYYGIYSPKSKKITITMMENTFNNHIVNSSSCNEGMMFIYPRKKNGNST